MTRPPAPKTDGLRSKEITVTTSSNRTKSNGTRIVGPDQLKRRLHLEAVRAIRQGVVARDAGLPEVASIFFASAAGLTNEYLALSRRVP